LEALAKQRRERAAEALAKDCVGTLNQQAACRKAFIIPDESAFSDSDLDIVSPPATVQIAGPTTGMSETECSSDVSVRGDGESSFCQSLLAGDGDGGMRPDKYKHECQESITQMLTLMGEIRGALSDVVASHNKT
jgi:hypothetical protein